MKMTREEVIATHTCSGKWKKVIDVWHCVYVKCVRCGKEYRYSSGKAIAKHTLNCKAEYMKKYL